LNDQLAFSISKTLENALQNQALTSIFSGESGGAGAAPPFKFLYLKAVGTKGDALLGAMLWMLGCGSRGSTLASRSPL